jgi:hypothetical protein
VSEIEEDKLPIILLELLGLFFVPNLIDGLFILIDLFNVVLAAVELSHKILSCNDSRFASQDLLVGEDDHELEEEGAIADHLKPLVIKPDLIQAFGLFVEVKDKIANDNNADETKTEDYPLSVFTMRVERLFLFFSIFTRLFFFF